jgi:glycosyltransferase involved in cell wall biosynthesis
MIKANNKKICIVVSSLGGGGAERSSGLLSEILYELGYSIYIVSVLNNIEFSYKGKLLNLGALKDKDDSVIGRLKRLRVFKNFIKEHNFDYVIDNRTRIGFTKEFVISKFIYNSKKTVYCVRSYNVNQYINPNRILGRLLYSNAYNIIAVSEAISNKIKDYYRLKNVSFIYNTVEIKQDETENKISEPYILFFGRLNDDVKNISLLLEAYSKSNLPSRKVDLKILGDGKDLEKLKTLVKVLKIPSNVQFLPHNTNPSSIVQSAFFTVLTSRYEGFPRMITESLAVGTPVISVDCKSGPNEIIVNEYNGLLVENYNPEALAKAMNRLLEDKDLYLNCKSHAKTSVAQFSKTKIAEHWQSMLK